MNSVRVKQDSSCSLTGLYLVILMYVSDEHDYLNIENIDRTHDAVLSMTYHLSNDIELESVNICHVQQEFFPMVKKVSSQCITK
jgi:hypothetical protein